MQRLDRFLSEAGVASRRELRAIIRAGRVRVNDVPASAPEQKIDETSDRVTLDGEAVGPRGPVVLLLHKPTGYVTSTDDPRDRTVMELLPPQYRGLAPVGRLDKDTTGLLLLTTDGELNHRLLAPARHVDKTYLATLDKPVGDKEVAVFASGLSLSDFEAAPADLKPLPDNRARVTIHEGKFHQVKRMFAAVEREVLTLHRETFGSLVLDEALPCGQWRELTEAEASALYRDAQMEEKHG